ncbi:MAG: D-glucuronyl C5-epimerase family protein, partial [Actinomycetota bacterium]
APAPGAPRPVEPPPPTVRIPAGAAADPDPVAALARVAAAAAPGSDTAADVTHLLELHRRHGSSDAQGRRATLARAMRANAWWYAQRAAPGRRTLLVDEDGVIYTYRRGHGFAVNPVATTGRWRRLNADVPAPALAATLLTMGVLRRSGDTEYLAWEYYDVADDPDAIRPGMSAMAQGRVANLLATAWRATGDPEMAHAARLALQSFTVPVDEGGVRSMVAPPGGGLASPWYVERAYPGDDPWKGAALNGFMVTLLNLRDAAAELRTGAQHASDPAAPGADEALAGADVARDAADRGHASLVRYLPLHDSGSWSYYGLLTPGRPWRTYLADLNYHCYHVALLRQLEPLYPASGLAATAARWQGYVDRAGLTCPDR